VANTPVDEKLARGLSARWLAVVTTFFIIAVTLAPPLQRYFAQASQINDLSAQVKASQQQLIEAEKQLSEINDPKFIESQARSRLHYIFPGEKQFIVIGLPSNNAAPTPPATDMTNTVLQNLPWYTKLISSIVSSNQRVGQGN
jgi:cell division protein FtsB